MVEHTGSSDDACKIERQISAYDLTNMNAELIRRRENDNASLRTLADTVNIRILDAALYEVDADVAGHPKSVYETLVSDDVPTEQQVDMKDQLTYLGIDVDELRSDFVSHQTISNHLNDCLGVDTSRSEIESLDAGREKIEWARSRDEHIIEHTIDQLNRADHLSVGSVEVNHSITITCTDCGDTFRVDQLLNQQECSCGDK
jgi:hypothetical protein